MEDTAKNKKYKIEVSKGIMGELGNLPDDVYEEFEKLIKGFKNGIIDPEKVGKPVDWIELKLKLICPECKSENVKWLFDKNSNEVDFQCLNCNKNFWMFYGEYKKAIEKNPDKIVI